MRGGRFAGVNGGRGNQNHGGRGNDLFHCRGYHESIEVRHVVVSHNHVEFFFGTTRRPDNIETLSTAERDADAMPIMFEHATQCVSHERMIVDDENAQ
jgi:hypothetical protein